MSRSRACAVTAAFLIVLAGTAPAGAWCNLPFSEIAAEVELVVLAEYRKARGEPAEVVVIEVFRGDPPAGSLPLDLEELKPFRPRHGSQFLLALNARNRLVRYLDRHGVCRPVNTVPLHKGKLRGEDRFEYYDNGEEPMTLDELRVDLVSHLSGR